MSDPLSPSALAQVPEVRQALKDCRESSWSQNEPALLLAVRDAVLQAERQRLLGMTPEDVVEAAARALRDYDGRDNTHLVPWNKLHADEEWVKEDYRSMVRAAAPILLAGERAKREAVEKAYKFSNAAMLAEADRANAAEAEVKRLRGALEKAEDDRKVFAREADALEKQLVAARAALGGARE